MTGGVLVRGRMKEDDDDDDEEGAGANRSMGFPSTFMSALASLTRRTFFIEKDDRDVFTLPAPLLLLPSTFR